MLSASSTYIDALRVGIAAIVIFLMIHTTAKLRRVTSAVMA
ncbi:hypothetical protein [Trinickia sp. EG282A]